MSRAPFRMDAGHARVAIAVVVAANVALLAAMAMTHAEYSVRPGGPAAWLGRGPAFFFVASALVVVALAGAWRFGRGRGSEAGRWGLACLVAQSVLWELANAASGNRLVENVAPGACLFGWLAGLAYARAVRVGDPDAENTLALRGAASAFGTGYVLAVVSKLLASGATWASPATLWSTVYAHRSVDAHGLTRGAADLLLASPLFAKSAAVATLLLESAAALLLGPARWRVYGAAAVLATHLGFLLFDGSTSPLPMLLALTFLLEGRQARREADVVAPDPRRAREVLRRAVVVAVVAIGVGVAIGAVLGRRPGAAPMLSSVRR